MALGDTGGDDDALPPLEELSGADASPRNGAGARGYDFDREDRRRGVRGAGTMRRLCYIEPASHGGHADFRDRRLQPGAFYYVGILHHAQRRATIKYRGQRRRGSGARGWLVGGVLDEKKREKSKRKLRPPFFIRSKTSSPFSRSATVRLHARSMQSPRSPHSVHGLPTCMCTRDAGAIAIVRAKCVLLGALSPGQKWRLYFRDFFPGFFSLFSRDPNDFERVLDI